MVGTDTLDVRTVGLLLEAGRYDCVLTSNTNAKTLVSQFLDAPAWRLYNRDAGAPLYLLPAFLSLTNLWLFGRGAFFLEPILELAGRFEANCGVGDTVQPLLPSGFESAALSISRKFSAVVKSFEGGVITSSELEEIIEECRSTWGERHALIASACSIAHLPRRSTARRTSIALLDHARPLCERLRSARLRAKDAAWWTEQMRGVQQASDRFLFHLAYWTWASSAVVSGMADELADALEQMQDAEWHNLLDFVQSSIGRLRLSARGDAPATKPTNMSSKRFALLVAFREQAVLGRQIFLEHFVQNGSKHPSIAEFRQAMAFDAALAGELEWRPALAVIRSTYADGAWSQIMRVSAGGPRRATLPEAIAQQVLSAPRDYPVHLWELAETGSAAKARKAVRAVGIVARKERWFSN